MRAMIFLSCRRRETLSSPESLTNLSFQITSGVFRRMVLSARQEGMRRAA